MRVVNKLLLASLNQGKQNEFRTLLEKHGLKLGYLDECIRNTTLLSQVEKKCDSATYEENASLKCCAVFQAVKMPTFADDSGIEIDALDNQPGVHSAHFGKISAKESQDQANRRRVLELLQGKANRKARMRCVLVFQVEGLKLTVEGVCEGRISEKETGLGGFGYDPLFLPDAGGGKTFAELSKEEKNSISHRALAVDALVRQMQEKDIQLVRP